MPTNDTYESMLLGLRNAVKEAMQNAVENGYGHAMIDELDRVAIDIMDHDATTSSLLEDLEDAGVHVKVDDVAHMVRELQSELGWRPAPGSRRVFRGETLVEGESGFYDACVSSLGRDPEPKELDAFIAGYVGVECTVVEHDDDDDSRTWFVRFDDGTEAVVLPFDLNVAPPAA